jgi:hypothetical protein
MNAILFPAETEWKAQAPLTKSRLFWFFQTLIAVLFITRIFYVQIRFYQERLKSDPKLRRKLILKKASYALKSQNWEEFLSLASNLARELDQNKTPSEFGDSLTLIIEADNQLRFSPSKTLTVSPDTLRAHWQKVGKALQNLS